jgi:type IV secretory pathway VirB9-like protein
MRRLFLSLLSASLLCAQDVPPMNAHRERPLSIEDIQAANRLLNPATAPAPQVLPPPPPVNLQEGPPLLETSPAAAPKGYRIRKEVALDSGTAQALDMATRFLERANVPHEGKDGRLVYTHGAGLATLVCAPLRWCLIELIPGETAKHAVPSDERWDARPLIDTSGEAAHSIIAMRPKFPGLDSSLVILTDKHSYYVRLISEPSRYMSRITFEDPIPPIKVPVPEITPVAYHLDVKAPWRLTNLALSAELLRYEQQIRPYKLSGEKDSWDREKRPYFWPVAAYEKGGLVYIELPKLVSDMRSPSLHHVGLDGKFEPLNYTTEGNTLIAHTLFDRAVLLRGDGKHAEKVFITRPEDKK